uniref:NTPase, KAP family P-loop domain containing 1 n=1 Tax=Amphilophus citrinellus TaxID=61819 RepID=A0A3Q0SWN9_AMPCI
MNEESLRIEQKHAPRSRPRSVKPSLTGFLALIGRLLLYNPVWTKENQQEQNVRFIYVHFSAWHFAGSDLLWAGIAIRLIQAMKMNFGQLQLALYLAKCPLVDKLWNVNTHVCPCLFSTSHKFSVGLRSREFGGQVTPHSFGQVGVLEGLVIAVLGVPAAGALRFIILMGKNLIFSQELNIKREMDNERISSQLGFMNEVRLEMWFLSRFIQFMEVFERRRIRIVLNIIHLDRCSPKKIVAVLDAMNILLSDEESPFISILAVNPEVLVEKVNFADGCFSKEDRAYALLNRIVTVAFTVPPLCNDSKQSLMDEGKITYSSDDSLEEVTSKIKESIPLIGNNTVVLDVKEDDVKSLIRHILSCSERNLSKYMLDDAMSMRRVISSIRVTVIIMKALKLELPQPEYIAAWVILANHWPCRLSWIIQCVEDAEQRADIDGKAWTSDYDSKTLWDVFSESRAELYVMRAQIEDILEQDGDAELFEKFLKVDFQFKIKDLKTFEGVMVNLDHSIRKELAQIRGTSRLKDSGMFNSSLPALLPPAQCQSEPLIFNHNKLLSVQSYLICNERPN